MLLFYFFIIGGTLSIANSARILAVYPSASISHQLPFRPLTLELVKRGHEVTVITTDPMFPKDKAPRNLREIDVHDTGYEFWRTKVATFATGNKDDVILHLNNALDMFSSVLEMEFDVPEFKSLITNKNETFDLILAELCVRPALVFCHLFNAPVIQVSSFGAMGNVYETVGSPSHPILYPFVSKQDLTKMTMRQKFIDFYNYMYFLYVYNKHEEVENAMLRKHFGDDTPTLTELGEKVQMYFLNVHPVWEDNRPVPPNVVYMGGIHQNPEKKLPKDLQSYLDSSTHGVIYFSLGSNVVPSLLPPERIQILANVFSKLPYDVLWKYDKAELPNKPPNVRIEKWLPQSDLLRHHKIKLFITQGGLQSTDEAIAAGVPLVGIPILGDQWLNVDKYVQHGIGVKLNFDTMTEESIKNAIDTVIRNESFRKNIKKLRDVMNDQPQSPLDRAVWWAEHVIRHGGAKHLKSAAANMSWTQYYEIDLVVLVLAILSSAIIIFIYTLYSLLKYINNRFLVTIKFKRS